MFKFKEKTNLEMGAILEEVAPLLSKTSIRFDEVTVPGRDSSIYFEKGFEPVKGKMTFMLRKSNEDDFKKWMNGSGVLVVDGKQTTMRVYDGYDLERVAKLKRVEVNFIRDPFWIKETDFYKAVSTTVLNEGNIISRPLIRLIKTTSDVVDISVNGIRFVYSFDTDGAVLIDCDSKTESWAQSKKSSNLEIGWEYPFLNPGVNTINFNSGTCSIEMMYESRWI